MGETAVTGIRTEGGTFVYIDKIGDLYRVAEYIPPDVGEGRGMLVEQKWFSARMFNEFAKRCTSVGLGE